MLQTAHVKRETGWFFQHSKISRIVSCPTLKPLVTQSARHGDRVLTSWLTVSVCVRNVDDNRRSYSSNGNTKGELDLVSKYGTTVNRTNGVRNKHPGRRTVGEKLVRIKC